jgi:hypothetical protein
MRDRHGHVARITVVSLPVREAELDGLREEVDVGGGIVTECGQCTRVHQIENLQEHRPLAPRAAGIDVDAIPGDCRRAFDLRAIVREILVAQPAALGHVIVDESRGEIAAIKGIPRGLQTDLPALSRRSLFLVHHVLQRPAKILVLEDLAHLWRAAIGKIERLARGPSRIAFAECPTISAKNG